MRTLFGLSLLAICGCRALLTPAPTGPDPALYWPMAAGQQMAFKLKMGAMNQDQVVTFTDQDGPWLHDDQGQRFRYDALGLFDGRRYLIKRPVIVGTQWMSVPEPGVIERFKVVALARRCASPHNTVSDCLVIEARQKIDSSRSLLTRWWYGRGIGPLRIDTFLQQSSGDLIPKSTILRELEDLP